MNEIELKEIQDKANSIINNNDIKVLKDEEQLLEQLYAIKNKNNIDLDFNLLNKTLDSIDTYIKYKRKMLLCKEDFDYLNTLANELKTQKTRRTDNEIYIPLFKIVSSYGDEKYFLTRDSAKNFIDLHKEWYQSEIIEYEESDNTNLLRIVDIIKRNF